MDPWTEGRAGGGEAPGSSLSTDLEALRLQTPAQLPKGPHLLPEACTLPDTHVPTSGCL